MLEKELSEFEALLHKIALAIGIAHKHPNPVAYADSVVDASKPPVIDPVVSSDAVIALPVSDTATNVSDTPTE